jgi:hypothetical protein
VAAHCHGLYHTPRAADVVVRRAFTAAVYEFAPTGSRRGGPSGDLSRCRSRHTPLALPVRMPKFQAG